MVSVVQENVVQRGCSRREPYLILVGKNCQRLFEKVRFKLRPKVGVFQTIEIPFN